MAKYKLSNKAVEDLSKIWEYTFEIWDEKQAEAFGQCNMITMNEGMPENYETYYWFAKIKEAKGLKEDAKMYYGFALEKYNDNPNLISRDEILKAMNK